MSRMSTTTILDQVCTPGDTFSETIPLDFLYGFSVEVDWTIISPVGESYIYLLATNDISLPKTSWKPIDSSAICITESEGHLYNVMWPMYRYATLYVKIHTGSLQVKSNFFAKGG